MHWFIERTYVYKNKAAETAPTYTQADNWYIDTYAY